MKQKLISFWSALLILAAASSLFAQAGQNQTQPAPDEQKMATAITAVPDLPGKLKAATDFIKKYPKSTLRPRVAQGLADQIADLTDAAQKLTLAQTYQTTFTEVSEQEMIVPVLIEGLALSKRPDDAYAKGTEFLKQNPDSLTVLVQLLAIGTDEAKAKNPKFADQSLQYGARAIQLVETDKRPAWMDDAAWARYKAEVLPSLHQSMGLLNLIKGDRPQARASYLKALELAPADPFNFVMLAGIVNDEYQSQAKKYQSTPNGPAKDEELKKAQNLLDATIDAYAHAIAVSEGTTALQAVRQQYLQDLEAYYKYRHNNSTAGMQQLIDKYKVAPPKP
jgi:tetratricopeptide (TPR) repeat protein